MIKYFVILLFLIISCNKNTSENIVPKNEETYKIVVPVYFGTMPQPSYNIATKEGVALGKKLFFDPMLSSNNKVSCATCHHSEAAFAETETKFSNKGVSQKFLHRHTPPLFNLAWHTGFFWDGGATNLESQVFGPITHADEQNKNLKTLVAELKVNTTYTSLFKQAFPKDSISSQTISYALSQFQRSLISSNSLYDSYLKSKDTSVFSAKQFLGYKTFLAKCETCHKEPFLTDFEYHNNGLDADFLDESLEGLFQGRYRITTNPADKGKYKTPTLRNIVLTAPYMHDGRFATLDSVLKHYEKNIKYYPTLDARLQNKIRLSITEKSNLISFLQTLTDNVFVNENK